MTKVYNTLTKEFSFLSDDVIGLGYIGIDDKHGRKIYDKDIVRFKECWSDNPSEQVGEVFYDSIDLAYYFDVGGDPYHPKKEVVEGTIEVIGNMCNMSIDEAIIYDHWDKNDELQCSICDWWGSPKRLKVNVNNIPVCPDCGGEDILYEINKNPGGF